MVAATQQKQENRYASVIEIMKRGLLFCGLGEEALMEILTDKKTNIKTYKKGQVVFDENCKPRKLFILLEGSVGVVKNTGTGKRIMISQIDMPGEIFGEIYLFMQKKNYEVQTETLSRSVIMELGNDIFLQSYDGKADAIEEKLRCNMLKIFAGKAYQMNRKVNILGASSVREKITNYLLYRQEADRAVIEVPGREEMADYMNIARPSLSRELMNMRDEGIISIEKGKIEIVNQELFESCL